VSWKICFVKGPKEQETFVMDERIIFVDMTPCSLVEGC
jgi:hypothetical protein